MAEIVKDLGVATAYGYAKANGYTGTEEEFGVLMASYATVADEAAASAAAASASAEDSADSAAEAAQKVLDAAAQVTLATEQAQAAAASAAEASGYATDASGSATDAETYKTQAQGFSQDAGADAAFALGYKNAAQTYAGNAETSADNAADSASAASTSATNAATSATNAANSATAAAASAEDAAESAAHLVIDDELSTESENAVQNKLITSALETKAEVDGAYEQMTVGNAEQLVSNVGIEDSVPYNFRTSGGSADIGDREVDKIVGGTIAWNQKVAISDIRESRTANGITITKNNDGSITYTGTATAAGSIGQWNEKSLIDGHIYVYSTLSDNTGAGVFLIGTNTSKTRQGSFNSKNGLTYNVTIYSQLFDLTQMFGSTIADYINSLETANAGAGVAWFRKLFPRPYYAYNAGELMSVQTSAHKMVGFNQFDKSEAVEGEGLGGYGNTVSSQTSSRSDYIKVLPSTTYQKTFDTADTTARLVQFFDADKNWYDVSGVTTASNEQTFTTPPWCHYIRIAFPKNQIDSVCLHIVWDGERDGEYEEYKQWVYSLDSDLVLRGIPKLSAGNDLYYDGDEYESDGTVTRKYAQIAFDGSSDEDWRTGGGSGAQSQGFYITCNDLVKIKDSTYTYAIRCNRLVTRFSNSYGSTEIPEYYVTGYNDTNNAYPNENWLYVKASNDITTVTAFRTWLAENPITVVYKLAEPTTESADPFSNPQIVSDWGTEEYVDSRDVQVPVGHETHYAVNLRAKLEMAPNSPSSSGLWVVKQTNGINEYVPLLFPASDIPAPPTDDGSYVLTVTVSDGTATYSWASST